MKAFLASGFLLLALVFMMNLSPARGSDRDRDRDLDRFDRFDSSEEDDRRRPRPHFFRPFPCVAGGSVCIRDVDCCSGECERGGRRGIPTCCGRTRSLCFQQSDCCSGHFCFKFGNPFGQGFCQRR